MSRFASLPSSLKHRLDMRIENLHAVVDELRDHVRRIENSGTWTTWVAPYGSTLQWAPTTHPNYGDIDKVYIPHPIRMAKPENEPFTNALPLLRTLILDDMFTKAQLYDEETHEKLKAGPIIPVVEAGDALTTLSLVHYNTLECQDFEKTLGWQSWVPTPEWLPPRSFAALTALDLSGIASLMDDQLEAALHSDMAPNLLSLALVGCTGLTGMVMDVIAEKAPQLRTFKAAAWSGVEDSNILSLCVPPPVAIDAHFNESESQVSQHSEGVDAAQEEDHARRLARGGRAASIDRNFL